MTQSDSTIRACELKALIRPAQADAGGFLHLEAAAALVAEGLDGFIARRCAGSDAGSAPRPRAVAMTLDRIGASPLRVGDIATCRIDLSADPTATKTIEAQLCGAGGAAWQAVLHLDHELPAALDGAVPEPALALPPLRLLRTMRSTHCDQAGHVNVQVFMDLVDEAATVLALEATGVDSQVQIAQARVSFKRELFDGDVVAVHSGIEQADAEGLRVVHGIVDRTSGALACVVETRLKAGDPFVLLPAEPVGDWPALPRARAPALPRPGGEPAAQAVTTSLSVVDAWDTDRSGRLSARALVNLCSTGARQYLASIGLDGARFLREQITVAAVDYLVDIHQRPLLGCNLALRSAFLSGSGKSIRFSHHLVDADNGAVYAAIEIVGVMFDLKTHRSMDVPRDVRQRLGLALD